MYIQPDTDVYLLKNVPLDPTYEHTVLWSSANAQEVWFTTHASYAFHNVSRQRHAENVIELQIDADKALMCNYMCFKNSAYGDKMFYAFITDVTYINNLTAAITYQLDVMQTWLFEAELEDCWVLREHSATDVPGEHTLPEPVDFGDYVVSSYRTESQFSNWGVMVNSAFTDS